MNVHQVLSGAGAHDAITTQAVMFRAGFRHWGWGGGDHAQRIAPGVNGAIVPLARLSAAPGDVLLIHHSAWSPRLGELLALPNPKLLLYHNITPACWLWEHAPLVAVHCAIGREQLPELVRAVQIAAAVSEYNAAELRALGAERTAVIPALVDRERLGPPRRGEPPGPPVILFVGRLSPHKRQDELIRVFSLYRRHHAPGARLMLVGDPVTTAYAARLRGLADALVPGAVRIESGLTDAELAERYRGAHAFVCLSMHEGFCIPLLEALHFGVPVIARATGAAAETVGDAAVLADDTDPAVLAELLHLAVSDGQLRAELRRRGRARLETFTPELVWSRLRAAVEAAAGRR